MDDGDVGNHDQDWPPPGGKRLIVAAHPDDETISCSAALARPGHDVTLIHVTDGAPRDPRFHAEAGYGSREAYASARRAERLAALAIAGVAPEQCLELGVADQEAALHLLAVAARLQAAILAERPAIVLTHPYEGGHPDHDACAFAARAAVDAVDAVIRREGGAPPALMEFTSYHRLGGVFQSFTFIPSVGEIVHSRALDAGERLRKERMYACYASQRGVLAEMPIGIERVRLAPRYDFTRPPHEGTLQYERFSSGMTRARWRELATAALAAIAGP